jgi:hypothetical protein
MAGTPPRSPASLLTAEERILLALRSGNSCRAAAGFAGVSWDTYSRWVRAGRRYNADPADPKGRAKYAPFAAAVEQARHEASVNLVSRICRAAEGGDWRAAECLLNWRAGLGERNARLRKTRAEAKLAEMRCAGTLPPDKTEHSFAGMTDGDLERTTRELELRLRTSG